MGKFNALQKVDLTKVAPRALRFETEGDWILRVKALKHQPKTKKGKSLVFADFTVIEGPADSKGKQYSYCYDITGVDDTNPAPQECARLICLLAQDDDLEKVMSEEALAYTFSDEQPFAGTDIHAKTEKTKSGFVKLIPTRLA